MITPIDFALVSAAAQGHQLIPAVLEITVVCALAGLLAQLLRMPFVPVLLVAGILVGPDALGVITALDRFSEISHVAVIILLFGVGLEIDLRSNAKSFLRECLIGAIACLICTVAIAVCVSFFGVNWQESLVLGMALSLSSTAVVLRILVRSRQLKSTFGGLSLSILVAQDILVLGMLASLPIIAASVPAGLSEGLTEEGIPALGYLLILGKMLGVVAIIIALRFALPRLMNIALKERTSDIVLFVGSAIALGITEVVSSLGFSREIGAFVAGLVLAGTLFRYQLGGQLAPFREFFLGIFFLTVGMQLNPLLLWNNLAVVLGLVLIILVCKVVGIFVSCRLMGMGSAVAAMTAFSLSQAGEFGLILMQEADRLAILSAENKAIALSAIIITLVITPLLLWLGQKVAAMDILLRSDLAAGKDLKDVVGKHIPPAVILVGYGPSGRRVGKFIESQAIPWHVIDLNLATIKQLKADGVSASLGDASQSEVLEHAGVADAQVIVIAIPDELIALRIAAAAKGVKPGIQVVIRLVHEVRVANAISLGLEFPVVEELVVGDNLADVVNRILNYAAMEQSA